MGEVLPMTFGLDGMLSPLRDIERSSHHLQRLPRCPADRSSSGHNPSNRAIVLNDPMFDIIVAPVHDRFGNRSFGGLTIVGMECFQKLFVGYFGICGEIIHGPSSFGSPDLIGLHVSGPETKVG